jgi:hypothetical protein
MLHVVQYTADSERYKLQSMLNDAIVISCNIISQHLRVPSEKVQIPSYLWDCNKILDISNVNQ